MTLTMCTDVSPAAWIVDDTSDWVVRSSFGPPVFPATLRLLHPTHPPHDRQEQLDVEGDLDQVLLDQLCDVLARHTGTPAECYFGLWEGFGDIWGSPSMSTRTLDLEEARTGHRTAIPPAFPRWFLDGPRVVIPARAYYLFTGPLEQAGQWPAADISLGVERGGMNSPNLMWPADHEWFVASEIDVPWTGVGGSEALIDDLMADERFDTVRTDPLAEQPHYR